MVSIRESAYWSFRKTLEEAQSANEIISGITSPLMREGVSFHGVCFSYGNKDVMKDITLTIPCGKLTVLTGVSGAGKTTIADLLTGLIRPQAGEILVDRVPLSEIDLLAWRQMIGYVPQEMFLFHQSVLRNITLDDNHLSRKDIEEALEKAGAWEFVSKLPRGVETIIGEHGAKISGGQRQRISLARALVRSPSLLVLDEVTAALDPETEGAVCRTLLQLRGEMAILAITHQPLLVNSADLVYHIEEGKIRPIEKGEIVYES